VEDARLDFGPLPRVTSRRLVAELRQVIDDKSNLRQL
jgi:copper homeostasis protein